MARERVEIGPAPDWIVPTAYNADFRPPVPGTATFLLNEVQVHAELRQTYVRTVMRLETPQAVQHQSQWRVQFEPQTQSLLLHSIKTRRGSVETEHAVLDQIQFLQREAGLEGLVIDGWVTLLLVLENVSPGDVLEWSYTLTNRPKLLPEFFTSFFAVPAGCEIGKCRFSVRHDSRRALKWKSSSPELSPEITTEANQTSVVWVKESLSSPEPEHCTPAWQLVAPWIQVSDCPDWQTVARAVLEAWKEEPAGEGLTKLIDELKSFSPDLHTRVTRAIELVQDEFRYLSVNIELGGNIPAAAETVVRRRYGDCKDLAFLLTQLLRALGVSARPVLVNLTSRKAVSNMLPAPGVFNHAIVEYEFENEKRWVDPTMQRLGGGVRRRCCPDYGVGLPIDATTTELAKPPKASLPWGSFETKESFLLDTIGKSSYVALLITATGFHADEWRSQFVSEGIDAVAKKRQQMCANRYSKATRVGQLQFRDNRELNEVLVAEVFEVEGFLKLEGDRNHCHFFVQNPAASMLVLPSAAPRRFPFGLPFPCNQVHTIELEFTGLSSISIPPYEADNEFFRFSRRTKCLPKYLRLTFSLETLADSVPPKAVPGHRKQVEAAWTASSFQIRLPVGYARLRKRDDFGALPPVKGAAAGETTALSSAAPSRITKPPSGQPASELQPSEKKMGLGQKRAFNPSPPRTETKTTQLSLPLPQVDSPRRGRSRGRQKTSKSLLSLYFVIGTVLLILGAAAVGRRPEGRELSGFLFLFSYPPVCSALALAVLGWKQSSRHPAEYPDGKVIAGLTLAIGGFIGLILLSTLPGALSAAWTGAKLRSQFAQNREELLKFKNLNFVFHSPSSPWVQVDGRRFGRSSVLGFVSPEHLSFSVCANPLETGLPDSRMRLVELYTQTLQRVTTSCERLSEGEVTHNGLTGWQIEYQISYQGHESYLLHWLLATNGYGYQLAIWGPPERKALVRDEADQMFSKFEPRIGD
jgi:hypothetical protein